MGIVPLTASLGEVLTELEGDPIARSWIFDGDDGSPLRSPQAPAAGIR